MVVWADPGLHTGWSVHRVPIEPLLSLGQVGSVRYTWWRTGVFRSTSTSVSVDSYLSLARAAYEKSEEEDVFVLGCEDFSLQMQSTDYWLLEPVRFLAVLRDRVREGWSVETQMPGERDIITDARLRLWGLWKPGPKHSRDAQKHGLAFLRRYATQPELRRRLG